MAKKQPKPKPELTPEPTPTLVLLVSRHVGRELMETCPYCNYRGALDDFDTCDKEFITHD